MYSVPFLVNKDMKKYIIKRLLQLIPILFGITILTFLLMYISPGDPAEKRLTARNEIISAQVLEEMREEMGLNRSFLVQYKDWLMDVCHGDFGISYRDNRPVGEKLGQGLKNTLILSVSSLLFAVLVSFPLGIYTAIRRNRPADYVIRFFSFTGNSIPGFLLSILLMYVFCIKLHIFPIKAKGTLNGLFLPMLALAIPRISSFVRQIRAEILEQMGKDYVHGLRCRGVKERIVLVQNVLHNAMIAIITLLGLSIGEMMAGSVVIETIFSWQGIGKLVMDSITARDYPVVQGFVLIMAVIYVGVNLLTDISYHIFDPRIERG